MAVTSEASAIWQGSLFEGSGNVSLDSSSIGSYPVNWKARNEGSDSVTTPEELLAASHAACFAMAFSHGLAGNNTPPTQVHVTASVTFSLEDGGVTGSHLNLSATVPDISDEDFHRIAQEAKTNCPISKALSGIEITLEAARA